MRGHNAASRSRDVRMDPAQTYWHFSLRGKGCDLGSTGSKWLEYNPTWYNCNRQHLKASNVHSLLMIGRSREPLTAIQLYLNVTGHLRSHPQEGENSRLEHPRKPKHMGLNKSFKLVVNNIKKGTMHNTLLSKLLGWIHMPRWIKGKVAEEAT